MGIPAQKPSREGLLVQGWRVSSTPQMPLPLLGVDSSQSQTWEWTSLPGRRWNVFTEVD